MKKSKKKKIFTNANLDGAGCAIVAKLAFDNNVDIEYCDCSDINQRVATYINSKDYLNYEMCYITNISINDSVAKYIDNFQPKEYKSGFTLSEHFCLIDNDKTALDLNKYWWCNVEVESTKGSDLYDLESDRKTICSTSRLFYYILCDDDDLRKDLLDLDYQYFVQIIDLYDTGIWEKNKEILGCCKDLNDLLYMRGREDFVNDWYYRLSIGEGIKFNSKDHSLLEAKKIKKDIM